MPQVLTSIRGRRLGLDSKDNLVMSGKSVATMKSTDVLLTSAQILALSGTPRTLVPAPGAGRVLIFCGAYFYMPYNSAAYGGIAAGEDFAIRYTDGSGAIAATLETTGWLDQTATQYRWLSEGAAPAATAGGIAVVPNAPLVAQITTGEITTGNSPIYVRTYYMDLPSVLPVPMG